MTNLGDVLAWKYGPVADTANGKIVAWRHPTVAQPDEQRLREDRAEYELHLESLAKEKARAKVEFAAKKQALITKLNLSEDEIKTLRAIVKEE